MKVWSLSKNGHKVEVTDTGWISGPDVDFLTSSRRQPESVESE